MSLFDLTGRTALVTGSTMGIGHALVRGLAQAGARVLLNGRNPQRLEEAVATLRSEGLEADALGFDVTDHDSVRAGKPGLDGHSNGAEQIAFRARDCGMEIDYDGIRLTPEQIVSQARNGAHVIGLSILSGSHIPLISDILEKMRAEGLARIPVVVGGIIPDEDAKRLLACGVARVYTPKDFELNKIMRDIITLADPESVAAQ